MRSNQESAELEVSAQEQLAEQGVVSQLEFKRSLLAHRQLTRQLTFIVERIAQLSELLAANLVVAQSSIGAKQEALDLVKETESRLVLRAGIAGVLQSLSIELGQSVVSGQQLALVGSMESLYAILDIPQSSMQYVDVGQQVEIDTRNGAISGQVVRVEPLVNNGTNTLYRVDNDSNLVHATTLQFGVETKDSIQVVSGALIHQRFILSDMSQAMIQESLCRISWLAVCNIIRRSHRIITC